MWVAIREEKDARVPAICSMHAVSEVIGSWKVKGKRERERERRENGAHVENENESTTRCCCCCSLDTSFGLTGGGFRSVEEVMLIG